MLYERIYTAGQLRDRFIAYDRDYYSYEGYDEIWEYFDELGMEDTELDVISVCCEFTEATIDEIRSNFGLNDDDDVEEFLNDNTWYKETIEDTFIYRDF